MKNWIRRQFRKKSRVYIMPTAMGGYLNGLIFLMFLLSIGYSNNLLLIFTLLLFGLNLMWLVQTHFHLHALRPENISVYPGHAQDLISVHISWKSLPKAPWNWQLKLESDHGDFDLVQSIDSETKTQGGVMPVKRGVHEWKYLKVQTSKPFGLYRTWIYFPLQSRSLVYPPLLSSVDLPLSGRDSEGEQLQDKKGYDDFRGLVQYSHDEARKISWKHYARSGDLLVKEGEEKIAPRLELDLNPPTDPELKEHYLSYIATQMVECQRLGIPFTLKVRSHQSAVLADCLKELTLC